MRTIPKFWARSREQSKKGDRENCPNSRFRGGRPIIQLRHGNLELLNEQPRITGCTSTESWDNVFWPEDTFLGVDLQSKVKTKRLDDTGKGGNANRTEVQKLSDVGQDYLLF